MSICATLRRGALLLPALLLACPLSAADDEPKPIAGIGPTGKITKVHSGFKYTEGPGADKDGNFYFSDVPNDRLHKINEKGELSTLREKSEKTNGMKFNAKGEIVVCDMNGRIVAVSPDGKQVRVVADKYEGNRFNAPNDLVIDKDGGVYFTDPSFGAPKPLPQGKTAVYYIAPDGKVTRIIDDLTNPNGVVLSTDEKTLYVVQTGPPDMMAYPIEEPGKLGKGRVFCKLHGKDDKPGTGGDGCTIDAKGNLYFTSTIGIQVFDKDGKFLGAIAFPEQPSNVTFGGKDRKTMFVTARTSVYSVPMEVPGHVFPGGKKE